jgi:hypothetical protein
MSAAVSLWVWECGEDGRNEPVRRSFQLSREIFLEGFLRGLGGNFSSPQILLSISYRLYIV